MPNCFYSYYNNNLNIYSESILSNCSSRRASEVKSPAPRSLAYLSNPKAHPTHTATQPAGLSLTVTTLLLLWH